MSAKGFENIAREAKDLDDFLSRPDLLEHYFKSLREYFGQRHSSYDSFKCLLEQLRNTKDLVPDLKKRLWETTDLGEAFSTSMQVRTFRRKVNPERWERYLETWLYRLEEQATEYYSLSLEGRNRKLTHHLSGLQTKINRIHEASGKNLKAGEILQLNFCKTLLEDKDARAAAAFVLHSELVTGAIGTRLQGEADSILNTLYQLREEKENLPFYPHFNVLAPLIKDLVPDPQMLLNDSTLFHTHSGSSQSAKDRPAPEITSITYRFNPVERRIHGIWKGIGTWTVDCVGGYPLLLRHLTPERWATIALEKSQLHYIERFEGPLETSRPEVLGFIHSVPLKHIKTGQILATTEFALSSPLLLEATDFATPSKSFFEKWLEGAMRTKPSDWLGFSISESNAFNSTQILSYIRRTLPFAFGQRWDVGDFEQLTPLASEISAISPRNGFANHYGGNMILDWGVPDAVRLTLLNAEASAYTPAEIEKLKELIQGKDRVAAWWGAITLANKRREDKIAIDLLLNHFEGAFRLPIKATYEPLIKFLRMKALEKLKIPPTRNNEATALWPETVDELTRWLARQRNSSIVQASSFSTSSILNSSEVADYTRRILRALQLTLVRGRTAEVRASAAKAIGLLKIKDLRCIHLLCRAGYTSKSLWRRNSTLRVRKAVYFALGDLGWDLPQISATLSRALEQPCDEDFEPQEIALDAIRKIKPVDQRIIAAIKSVIETSHVELIRNKAAAVANELSYFSKETIETSRAIGILSNSQNRPTDKMWAIGVILNSKERHPRIVEILEKLLFLEPQNEIRTRILDALSKLYVPNRWTLVHISRMPLETRQDFISGMFLKTKNSSLIYKAMREAIKLDASICVFDFAKEIKEHLGQRKGFKIKVPFFETIRWFVGEKVLVSFSIASLVMILCTIGWSISFMKYHQLDLIKKNIRETLYELKGIENWLDQAANGPVSEALNTQLDNSIKKTRTLLLFRKKGLKTNQFLNTVNELLEQVQYAASHKNNKEFFDKKWKNQILEAQKELDGIEKRKYEVLITQSDEEKNAILLYTTFDILEGLCGCLIALFAVWAVNREMTNRIRAETAAREAERQFHLSIACIKDHCTFIMTPHGQVTTWNEAAEKMTGYSTNEIIGKDFSIFFSKKSIRSGHPGHALKQGRLHGTYEINGSIAGKEGTFFLADLTLTALKDSAGNQQGFVTVIHKLSEQKGVRRGNLLSLTKAA